MNRAQQLLGGAAWSWLALAAACAPARFQPRAVDLTLPPTAAPSAWSQSTPAIAPGAEPAHPIAVEAPNTASIAGELHLDTVLRSVTSRYPPLLAKLLDRDLASGRLQAAMGRFDTNLSAKVGGRLQGYYESSLAQAGIEQPLASGDTIYGGYRITDGFLPAYYTDRTQDSGRFYFGGRFPLLQDRSIDGRRAAVRKAEIDAALAEPGIVAARIVYVQQASRAYYRWAAAGRKLTIARDLLDLAEQRRAGLQRAVERQFLAPMAVTDNDRLIAQRRIYVARAERALQATALELSLFLRGDDDLPLVADEANLPDQLPDAPTLERSLDDDLRRAAQDRPDLRALELEIQKTETDRDLAQNRVLPDLDVIVEAATPLSDGPYNDREDLELFVGGELKLPLQRRKARGELVQAQARLTSLQLQRRFARDRITNGIVDARSAIVAAARQFDDTRRNVDLAAQMVEFEQRKFALGRSDLLDVQLREAQLADARGLAIEARLALLLAFADYRAALGYIGTG